MMILPSITTPARPPRTQLVCVWLSQTRSKVELTDLPEPKDTSDDKIAGLNKALAAEEKQVAHYKDRKNKYKKHLERSVKHHGTTAANDTEAQQS